MAKSIVFTPGKSSITYKVGRTLSRRNAKRHHAATIYAETQEEAVEQFDKLVSELGDFDKYRYELCTGDWKVIKIFN